MKRTTSISLFVLGMLVMTMILIHLITLLLGNAWFTATECFLAAAGFVIICHFAKRRSR